MIEIFPNGLEASGEENTLAEGLGEGDSGPTGVSESQLSALSLADVEDALREGALAHVRGRVCQRNAVEDN